eukprot:3579695-Alexandrium_andersonii.AAC.1
MFNRIVALDVFYLPHSDRSTPLLSAICHGSNYHQRWQLPDVSSEASWKAFYQGWVTVFGPPELVIADGGGEFQDRFSRGCE